VTVIKFSKMHGLGNDYVYFNCLEAELTNPQKLAIKLSDRHFGIGADGIVLIVPSKRADFGMRMFNADGSEAQMCGNAARCVGKFIYDKGLSHKNPIQLETKAGIKTLILKTEQEVVASVTVDLGEPILEPKRIPVALNGQEILSREQEFGGKMFSITCVSMGNPHCIIFTSSLDDELVNHFGPIIENSPVFPERTNVEFVKIISPYEMQMRVWERGSGETLACGTGAGAVCVAAALNQLTERNVQIELLGGTLQVEWASDNHVYKTGPAELVYEGEIEV
jgi:diaminopimelate epimerase